MGWGLFLCHLSPNWQKKKKRRKLESGNRAPAVALPHISCGSYKPSSPNLSPSAWCFVPDPNSSRRPQEPFPGHQEHWRQTHILLTAPVMWSPQSHAQICSRKSAVVSFSHLTIFLMDHKDLLFQPSFPIVIPVSQSPTLEHINWDGQEHSLHILKIQRGSRNQGTKHLPNKDKSRNRFLDL